MGRANVTRAMAIALLLGTLGCGDDGDAGGKPSCAQLCDRIEAPECPNAAPDCEAACRQDMAQTPSACAAELDALSRCFGQATFTCDAEGVPTADDCKDELSAWSACLETAPAGDDGAGDGGDGGDGGNQGGLCAAQPADNACDSCMKGACCDELTSCGTDCQALLSCFGSCTTQSCVQDCVDAHPDGALAVDALFSCVDTSCAASCSDEGSEPSTDACLPGAVPEGYCDVAGYPVGHDCPGGQPFDNCVLSPTGAANVYCCDQ